MIGSWNEKPKVQLGGEYSGLFDPFYDAEEMDDFHKKLKVEWDDLITDYELALLTAKQNLELVMELRKAYEHNINAVKELQILLIDRGLENEELREEAEKWVKFQATLKAIEEAPIEVLMDEYECERRLKAVRTLVEDWLPQIPMTIDFRRKFYEATGFEAPEWFKDEMEVEE